METNTPDIIKFQVGEEVATRSLCDWDCIFRFKVVSRTAKFVTFEYFGQLKRVGVKVWDGREVASPLGNHSMSATVAAGENISLTGHKI